MAADKGGEAVEMRAVLERLASVPSFNIWAIDTKDPGKVAPWYEVDPRQVVEELSIHETDLGRDVHAISVQIMHWGRLEALAQRVWCVEERRYRIWRSGAYLALTRAPVDDAKWKKPTETAVEAAYRVDAKYAEHQTRIERAQEAYQCARLIREAFVAKREMLRHAVYRAADGSAPRLSI